MSIAHTTWRRLGGPGRVEEEKTLRIHYVECEMFSNLNIHLPHVCAHDFCVLLYTHTHTLTHILFVCKTTMFSVIKSTRQHTHTHTHTERRRENFAPRSPSSSCIACAHRVDDRECARTPSHEHTHTCTHTNTYDTHGSGFLDRASRRHSRCRCRRRRASRWQKGDFTAHIARGI